MNILVALLLKLQAKASDFIINDDGILKEEILKISILKLPVMMFSFEVR